MKKTILFLGITCLISALLQGVILKGFSMFVPYLAFCVCSFIVCKGNLKVLNIFKIILFGAIVLPIFDFVFSTITAPFTSGVIATVAVVFVQTLVYFFVFVWTHSWVNKKKIAINLKNDAIIPILVLIYSVLNGIYTVAIMNSINQAIQQGNIVSSLSAFGNSVVSIIAIFVFYIGVFHTAVQTSKK